MTQVELIREFNLAWYRNGQDIHVGSGIPWKTIKFLGYDCQKNPCDLWIYQEILTEVRPNLIVECGTGVGGTTLYLASLCELLHYGHVVSIDLTQSLNRPAHRLITYWQGNSTDAEMVENVYRQARWGPTLVILDSDHNGPHVLNELHAYAPIVSLGSYLIVEDTNLRYLCPESPMGPLEAVQQFLASTDEFEVDTSREKFWLTYNPSGYLKRVKHAKG